MSSPERFDHLLSLVHDRLVRKFHVREPISPTERLADTLRYLASGDSQTLIGFLFKMGRSTVNGIIEEVCTELWRVLSPDYVRRPTTATEWNEIAEEFHKVCDMPNCIGALDGKHIRMRKPAESGSLWHNCKGFFSMILMTMVEWSCFPSLSETLESSPDKFSCPAVSAIVDYHLHRLLHPQSCLH